MQLTDEQVKKLLAETLGEVEMPEPTRQRIRSRVMAKLAEMKRDQAMFTERDRGEMVDGVTLFA